MTTQQRAQRLPQSTTQLQVSGNTRIVVRPFATPLPLGFLALGVATASLATVQLGWVPASEGHTVAWGALLLTVPLQVIASVLGFLTRDPVAATGMGILAGTWAFVSVVTLTSPPGATSPGLGVLLWCSAASLLVPAVAARTKLVPAAVITLSAVRFAVTGTAHLTAAPTWLHAAGWVGLALAALSWYAALALEIEASDSRTVLPLGRLGHSWQALDGDLADQEATLAAEPGVRREL